MPLARPKQMTFVYFWFWQIAVMATLFSRRVIARIFLTLKHLSLLWHTYTMLMSLGRTIGTKKSISQLFSVIVAIGLTLSGSHTLIFPAVDAVAKYPFPSETRHVMWLESTSLITWDSYMAWYFTQFLFVAKLGSATSFRIPLYCSGGFGVKPGFTKRWLKEQTLEKDD